MLENATQIYCHYCFGTLDPNDPDETFCDFVQCKECDATYHKYCQDEHPVCSRCENTTYSLLHVSNPSPLRAIERQALLPAAIVEYQQRRKRIIMVSIFSLISLFILSAVVSMSQMLATARENERATMTFAAIIALNQTSAANNYLGMTTTVDTRMTQQVYLNQTATSEVLHYQTQLAANNATSTVNAQVTATVVEAQRIFALTNAPTFTPIPSVTNTPRPTSTRRPTLTPRPTSTRRPILTPRPTSTPRSVNVDIAYGDNLNQSASRADEIEFVFQGRRGDVVTILLMSDSFDPYLEVWHNRRIVAENDDGAGYQDSLINGYRLPNNGIFTIIVRAYEDATFSGDYNLRLISGELVRLQNGIGQSNGQRVGNGEFQVEYFCTEDGYGTTHNDVDWHCTRNGRQQYTLQPSDYNRICQDTYNRSDAFALRNGNGSVLAFSWVCYAVNTSSRPVSSNTPDSPGAPQTSCRGAGETLFRSGDAAVVDFNGQGALRLLRDYRGEAMVTLAQYYDNNTIQLLDGPECYNGVWYWQVYNDRLNAYGWVAEGRDGDRFLCPTSQPECS